MAGHNPTDTPEHISLYQSTACTGMWSESEERSADEKHFTDAECTEEWNAAEKELFFALGDIIDGIKPDREARYDRAYAIAVAWRRFANEPHALENRTTTGPQTDSHRD